jgi:PAS domain S-box-containing protein
MNTVDQTTDLKASIHFIAPYHKMVKDIESEAKKMGLYVQIHEGLTEKGLELAQFNDVEIIIARGGTAEALRNLSSNISVVDIPVTGFDIIKAILEAEKMWEKVCIVGYDNFLQQISQVNDLRHIFKCCLETHVCHTKKEVETAIRMAKAKGFNCIVGGVGSCQLAEYYGLHGVIIESNRESIKESLKQAANVLQIKSQERKKSSLFKAIMNYTFEGIMSTDAQGTITACNTAAIDILEFKHKDLIGCKLEEVSCPHEIRNLLASPGEKLNELIELNEKTIVVNKVPLIYKGTTFGFVITLKDVTKVKELEQSLRKRLRKRGLQAKVVFDDIIHQSSIMKDTIEKAKNISLFDSCVLIEGETGSGKEMFAQSIHNNSNRKNGPFVAINCSALTESLLESMLFGYSEGAFTGAKKEGKVGIFELAHGGTIFLDEISGITPKLQMSLLRVIEEKEVMRLGDDKIIPIDVRVIAATNYPLIDLVRKQQFREDLYYRLSVLKLAIPPLRERKKDILLLLEYFLANIAHKYKLKIPKINNEVKEIFLSYNWPGNVRELRNVAENLVIMQKKEICIKDIEGLISTNNQEVKLDNWEGIDLKKISLNFEKELISTLIKSGLKKQEIAKMLGVTRSTLWRKMKQ